MGAVLGALGDEPCLVLQAKEAECATREEVHCSECLRHRLQWFERCCYQC